MTQSNNNELIEQLLYEEEGVTIDFKKDSYKFSKATDEEKSELLKDILSFANAWRRADAFILIGVDDVKGGKANVIGVSDLIDDASIQQFVNSKTNKPIIFSYNHVSIDGKIVAAIQLPVQERPFYLKKNFGNLLRDIVYVRRGSSTDAASIEEISRMGNMATFEDNIAEAELFFADLTNRKRLEDRQTMFSTDLLLPKGFRIPNYVSNAIDQWSLRMHNDNPDYYRELVKHARMSELAKPFYFCIRNKGNVSISSLRVEIEIPANFSKIVVMDRWSFPIKPRAAFSTIHMPAFDKIEEPPHVRVREVGNHWIVECEAERLYAKDHCWFSDPIWIGGTESGVVELNASLFGVELKEPIRQKLYVEIVTNQKHVDLEDIKKMARERFMASREGRRLKRALESEDE